MARLTFESMKAYSLEVGYDLIRVSSFDRGYSLWISGTAEAVGCKTLKAVDHAIKSGVLLTGQSSPLPDTYIDAELGLPVPSCKPEIKFNPTWAGLPFSTTINDCDDEPVVITAAYTGHYYEIEGEIRYRLHREEDDTVMDTLTPPEVQQPQPEQEPQPVPQCPPDEYQPVEDKLNWCRNGEAITGVTLPGKSAFIPDALDATVVSNWGQVIQVYFSRDLLLLGEWLLLMGYSLQNINDFTYTAVTMEYAESLEEGGRIYPHNTDETAEDKFAPVATGYMHNGMAWVDVFIGDKNINSGLLFDMGENPYRLLRQPLDWDYKLNAGAVLITSPPLHIEFASYKVIENAPVMEQYSIPKPPTLSDAISAYNDLPLMIPCLGRTTRYRDCKQEYLELRPYVEALAVNRGISSLSFLAATKGLWITSDESKGIEFMLDMARTAKAIISPSPVIEPTNPLKGKAMSAYTALLATLPSNISRSLQPQSIMEVLQYLERMNRYEHRGEDGVKASQLAQLKAGMHDCHQIHENQVNDNFWQWVLVASEVYATVPANK